MQSFLKNISTSKTPITSIIVTKANHIATFLINSPYKKTFKTPKDNMTNEAVIITKKRFVFKKR